MWLILIFVFIATSLALVLPSNQLPADSTGDECPIIRERKTLDWDFLLYSDTPEPRLVNFYDLVAPSTSAGFVWRGEAFYHPDVTRPILFQNGQGWAVVNCTSYFTADNPAQGGCTSPHLALLSTPGTKTGDAPPDKGKIGTINALTYPELSPWAVYDLIEFRLTPVLPPKYYDELITVEVFGWFEDGSKTTTLRLKIKGSEVGYKVELPEGGWNKILQWQVRVWWSAGSRPTREEFQYLIDDVVIDEYALGSTNLNCRYPMQTPKGPPGATVTLAFDDIPTSAGSFAAVPTLYHDYLFDGRYGSWNVTNYLSYETDSPGRLSITSKPNALLATPRYDGTWKRDPNVIVSRDFLFDVDSLHIAIDNSTTVSQNPSDIIVVINSHRACYEDIHTDYESTAVIFMEAPSFSFTLDLASKGFKKYRTLSIFIIDYGTLQYIPFWVDTIVVRSWGDALEQLPGCERCGYQMSYFCEYPIQDRPDPTLLGGEDFRVRRKNLF